MLKNQREHDQAKSHDHVADGTAILPAPDSPGGQPRELRLLELPHRKQHVDSRSSAPRGSGIILEQIQEAVAMLSNLVANDYRTPLIFRLRLLIHLQSE